MNQNTQQTLTNGNPTGITGYHHHPMNNNSNMTSHNNSTATNAAANACSSAERNGGVQSLNDDHHNNHQPHQIDFDEDDIDDGVEDDSDGDMTASLPKALIVTGLDTAIFEDIDCKEEFENLFKAFDDSVDVHYLKCFRRARVVFSSSLLAATARIHLHETELGGKTLKCYFAQMNELEQREIKCLAQEHNTQPGPGFELTTS
uniref:RRM domain-containing protein n=1 Tax=Octopus bimaculoides TaxID=37653 RepID=A0A0L8GZK7_OCTBM